MPARVFTIEHFKISADGGLEVKDPELIADISELRYAELLAESASRSELVMIRMPHQDGTIYTSIYMEGEVVFVMPSAPDIDFYYS